MLRGLLIQWSELKLGGTLNLDPQLGGTLHFGPHLKDLLDRGLMVGVGRGLMTGRGPMTGMGMRQAAEMEEWALEQDMELPALDKVLLVPDTSPLFQRKGVDM